MIWLLRRDQASAVILPEPSVTSIVYPRLATPVDEDLFGVLRDRVVVSLRFGCRAGSVGDVSASEAFSAVANAASPLIKSIQASSYPLRRPVRARCKRSGDIVSVYAWPLMLNSLPRGLSSLVVNFFSS